MCGRNYYKLKVPVIYFTNKELSLYIYFTNAVKKIIKRIKLCLPSSIFLFESIKISITQSHHSLQIGCNS